MIRGKFLTSADDLGTVLELRRAVFGGEGLASGGEDPNDRMAVYALAFDDDDRPSGAGRLYLDEDCFMIGCVGVLPEKRARGLGDLVMRMLLFRAQELNAPKVFARATPGCEAFFARYGFRPAEEADDRDACGALLWVSADEIAGGGCGGHKG